LESSEEIAKAIKQKLYKKESRLLNPKLIDYKKGIMLFSERLDISYLAVIIRNFFFIIYVYRFNITVINQNEASFDNFY